MVRLVSRTRFPSARLRAFSLAEITVAALVLLLLSAIATVSLFGMRDRGEDSSAQATLSNLEIAQRFHVRDVSSFATSPTELSRIDDNYTYVDFSVELGADDLGVVSVGTSDGGQSVTMATPSKSGTCFAVRVFSPSSNNAPVTDMWTIDAESAPCSSLEAVNRSTHTPWGMDS
ncbi:MAG: hypothetical protein ACF8TS_22480 [Maioricimonas sp. JB049]